MGAVEAIWIRSGYRPGFYYVVFHAVGFAIPDCYAVVDDFGNLVQVKS